VARTAAQRGGLPGAVRHHFCTPLHRLHLRNHRKTRPSPTRLASVIILSDYESVQAMLNDTSVAGNKPDAGGEHSPTRAQPRPDEDDDPPSKRQRDVALFIERRIKDGLVCFPTRAPCAITCSGSSATRTSASPCGPALLSCSRPFTGNPHHTGRARRSTITCKASSCRCSVRHRPLEIRGRRRAPPSHVRKDRPRLRYSGTWP
jgi:hypothetical protein